MTLLVGHDEPVADVLASQDRAAAALHALVAEHRLEIEEWDFTQLDGEIGDRILAIHDSTDRTIAVPINHDPRVRLQIVRRILFELGEQP
ncbi:hypothetical protein [Streptomyces adustus]|uniref:hypothetical protein n=1 Tax=Streptomyces adustus TaxID=1609272 RepID=UPI003719DFC2